MLYRTKDEIDEKKFFSEPVKGSQSKISIGVHVAIGFGYVQKL